MSDSNTFQCSLWFNSSKADMRDRLDQTQRNGGVGIHIGGHTDYFSQSGSTVELEFDDGTTGTALVRKNSWKGCPHLIDKCIGRWARSNGLWRQKLSQRKVPVTLEVIIPFKRFNVSQ